nr:MAG TPA: hypothetical protein [Caudoviricetes sp.]
MAQDKQIYRLPMWQSTPMFAYMFPLIKAESVVCTNVYRSFYRVKTCHTYHLPSKINYIILENRYPRMWRNPRNELYHKL